MIFIDGLKLIRQFELNCFGWILITLIWRYRKFTIFRLLFFLSICNVFYCKLGKFHHFFLYICFISNIFNKSYDRIQSIAASFCHFLCIFSYFNVLVNYLLLIYMIIRGRLVDWVSVKPLEEAVLWISRVDKPDKTRFAPY